MSFVRVAAGVVASFGLGAGVAHYKSKHPKAFEQVKKAVQNISKTVFQIQGKENTALKNTFRAYDVSAKRPSQK